VLIVSSGAGCAAQLPNFENKMAKVYLKVELNIVAECDDDVTSADSIMEHIDIQATGNDEIVEVYQTEIENFELLDAK
jgi:hypothetical protein